ncbi:MAG: methyltransferase [Armatimonadetes bacterium]|nr:methyltransferase [Armatimonadota bacterium]MDW8122024.1 methyltransferase [Armatimonadota bacterium]
MVRPEKRDKDHYFSETPSGPHQIRTITVQVGERRFYFQTDRSVFSRGGLDRGSRLLIERMEIPPKGNVLDWGCGYGPIGLIAAALNPHAHIWMVDINERAVALARQNALLNHISNVTILKSDGISALPSDLKVETVVSNPPIRAGKKVLAKLIEEAHQCLTVGGSLWLVAPTWLGARSLQKMMQEVFGNAECVDRKGGYRVLRSVKSADKLADDPTG